MHRRINSYCGEPPFMLQSTNSFYTALPHAPAHQFILCGAPIHAPEQQFNQCMLYATATPGLRLHRSAATIHAQNNIPGTLVYAESPNTLELFVDPTEPPNYRPTLQHRFPLWQFPISFEAPIENTVRSCIARNLLALNTSLESTPLRAFYARVQL